MLANNKVVGLSFTASHAGVSRLKSVATAFYIINHMRLCSHLCAHTAGGTSHVTGIQILRMDHEGHASDVW